MYYIFYICATIFICALGLFRNKKKNSKFEFPHGMTGYEPDPETHIFIGYFTIQA
jgi:hypothetical protein